MKLTSVLAIYLLFWVMSAFVVLPFHVRTSEEADAPLTPGQAESAPAEFKPLRIIAWTTMVATLSFGLYYANYVYGWIGGDSLSLMR
jgi:predicted secreted protein